MNYENKPSNDADTKDSSEKQAKVIPIVDAQFKKLLDISRKGTVRRTPENMVVCLRHHPDLMCVFAKNEFTNRVEKRKNPPWNTGKGAVEDTDLHQLIMWYSKNLGFVPSIQAVEGALIVAGHSDRFDPLVDHIMGLQWDSIPRLNNWLTKYLGADDTELTRSMGRKFLISAIARGLKPGCKADCALVLEGAQGIKKSTSVENLAGPFFNDVQLNLQDKDTLLALNGVWFTELSELSGMNKSDVDSLKRFMSMKSDRFRPPYARLPIEAPRRCVFIGTTNNSDYLQDTTGNRRFWPVRVSKIDEAALRRDRDALLAEAREAFFANESWWFTDDENHLVAAQKVAAQQRTVEDPWFSVIDAWLQSHRTKENQGASTSELLNLALGIDVGKQDVRVTRRVSTIMKQLGWSLVRSRGFEGRGYRWMPANDGDDDADGANEP
jgi:putative DNA primase/helicase